MKSARAIAAELRKFSPALAKRERWLVMNKIDLLEPAARTRRIKEIVRRLRWTKPVYQISAATGEGCQKLAADLMMHLQALAKHKRSDHE